ncbi:hypothetical protein Pmani_016875 [Petrolisthes manimaculis]|uniref:Uncharacterized protein n=1 Tax=Petrolisthes manimaculis TaxID=1843537 RepID=A0AAE1PPH3_9EUCA|nr:hypothetical protein Pmani_016875 [Petrolisthes manimaculis]
MSQYDKQSVYGGDVVTLLCEAQGFPIPSFSRFRVSLRKLVRVQEASHSFVAWVPPLHSSVLPKPSPYHSLEPFSSESPKVAEMAKSNTFSRHQGTSFALACRAQGFPVPQFRDQTGSTLHPSLQHTGTPTTLIQPASLSTPRLELKDKFTGLASTSAVGESAVMTCSAQAHPPPKYRSDPAGLSSPHVSVSEKLIGLASQTWVGLSATLTCLVQAHPPPKHRTDLHYTSHCQGFRH